MTNNPIMMDDGQFHAYEELRDRFLATLDDKEPKALNKRQVEVSIALELHSNRFLKKYGG